MSNCGDPLEIEISSRDLNWQGVMVEKGMSPFFYPDNVYTKDFYLALGLESHLDWEVIQNDKQLSLITQPGDIWLTPPNTPFTHKVDEPCYFIILTIDPETLYNNFQGNLPQREIEFLKSYNVSDANLKNIIELFYFEVINKGRNGLTYFNNLIKTFSTYFIKNYSNYYQNIIDSKQVNKISENDLYRLEEFIKENIEQRITIDDLAEKVNMSKFYFLKEFKKIKQITPYQYILKFKMEKAIDLLMRTDLPLTSIAYNLDFSDQSHFNNTFKRFYGKSPNKYRLEHQ